MLGQGVQYFVTPAVITGKSQPLKPEPYFNTFLLAHGSLSRASVSHPFELGAHLFAISEAPSLISEAVGEEDIQGLACPNGRLQRESLLLAGLNICVMRFWPRVRFVMLSPLTTRFRLRNYD
jgi:hypothetical protein